MANRIGSHSQIMISVGDIDLYLFNDAAAWVDPGGIFGLVPRVLWSRYLEADHRQLAPLAHHNLLLRAGGLNIIVDTGFGNCLSEAQQKRFALTHSDGTQAGLAALGFSPADIDIVFNTHLHDDHCSGNFRIDPSGQRVPAFPNAEYLVGRREFEDACQPNERTRATYSLDNYLPLRKSGQLRLLDGDATIAPGFQALATPGHTPGHMSLRLESRGQQAGFVCDLASLAVHMERLAWMTAYDVEPLVTLETKRRWQAWALETNALLVFPHDLTRPAGRLTQNEKGHVIVDVVEIPRDNP
ncbi:MAG: MBL fold metallo-hydrolase [Chloroflexota bacterium]|nr:MBL fold metallo-hydrolase [Chloroflexota bacterium]